MTTAVSSFSSNKPDRIASIEADAILNATFSRDVRLDDEDITALEAARKNAKIAAANHAAAEKALVDAIASVKETKAEREEAQSYLRCVEEIRKLINVDAVEIAANTATPLASADSAKTSQNKRKQIQNKQFRCITGSYFGQLNEAGEAHGRGRVKWNSGPDRNSVYVGHWQNGHYHGKGILISGKRSVYEGRFANGEKEGPFTIRYGNSTSLVLCANDRVYGKGVRFNTKARTASLLMNGISYGQIDLELACGIADCLGLAVPI